MHLHKPAFASIALSAQPLWHSVGAVPTGATPNHRPHDDTQVPHPTQTCSQVMTGSLCTKPTCTHSLLQHRWQVLFEARCSPAPDMATICAHKSAARAGTICHAVPVLQLYVKHARCGWFGPKHHSLLQPTKLMCSRSVCQSVEHGSRRHLPLNTMYSMQVAPSTAH